MKILKKVSNFRFTEFIFIISIFIIFEIAFMMRFDYKFPFSYYFITIASISIIPGIILLIKSSKMRFILYAILLLVSLGIFVTNSCLFYYKKDIFSLGMISDIGDGMNMGIKYNIFIAFGIGFWLFLFSYIGLITIVLFKNLYKNNQVIKPKFTYYLVLIISILILATPKIYINDADEPIYTSPQDKRTYLYTFGISSYNYKDMTSILANVLTQNSRKIKAKSYLNDLNEELSEDSPLFGQFENKNLIMIMTETVEEYAIDEKLTPTLHELFYGKYSFTNAYGVGKSNYTYDAEFKSLTSMMYFNSDNLMHKYDNNEFTNAIPHILNDRGYTTASFHSFNGEFFNRVNMHPALGFQNSYFEDDMVFSETDYWALDSEMFMQMRDIISPIQEKPFMSFITTLTSHGNFEELRSELTPYYQTIEEDGRYSDHELEFKTLLAAQMDLDKGLKIMLDDLIEKNLEQDTLIVIFSDHKNYSAQSITKKYSQNIIIEEYDYDRIPFGLYHPSFETIQYDNLTSHYDIAPTILDLMGIKYNKNYYYGQSVFLYLNGKYVEKPMIFGFNRWIHSDMIVYDKEIVYYNLEFTEEQIEESNNKLREEVYKTIEKYHAFFLTDYFRKTAID